MARPSPSSTRALYESFSALSASWPRDALRPELSFGKTMLGAVEGALTDPSPSVPPPPQTASSQGVPTRLDARKLAHREDLKAEEKAHAVAALRALENIRRGKAAREFPVPDAILRPSSNPDYYARLHSVLEKAGKGEKVVLSFRQRMRLFFGLPLTTIG